MTATDWTSDVRGTGQYAEVNGINLYFETHGAGRPMILLHGGLVDSGLWDLAGHLAGRATRPGLPSPVLPLLLGSIVVLAVVSSSSGHHHRCDCC